MPQRWFVPEFEPRHWSVPGHVQLNQWFKGQHARVPASGDRVDVRPLKLRLVAFDPSKAEGVKHPKWTSMHLLFRLALICIIAGTLGACAVNQPVTLANHVHMLEQINVRGQDGVADLFLRNGSIDLVSGLTCDTRICAYYGKNGELIRTSVDSIDAIRFYEWSDGFQRRFKGSLLMVLPLGTIVAFTTIRATNPSMPLADKSALIAASLGLCALMAAGQSLFGTESISIDAGYTTYYFRDALPIPRRVLGHSRGGNLFGGQVSSW